MPTHRHTRKHTDRFVRITSSIVVHKIMADVMRRTVLRVHKIIAELKYPALAEINLAASVRPTGAD